MIGFVTLMQALGLAYAAGFNLYATVAVTGLAVRYGWVQGVPTTVEAFANLGVIVVAVALYAIEFAATLVPGVINTFSGRMRARP